jgi:hypothetical protein
MRHAWTSPHGQLTTPEASGVIPLLRPVGQPRADALSVPHGRRPCVDADDRFTWILHGEGISTVQAEGPGTLTRYFVGAGDGV